MSHHNDWIIGRYAAGDPRLRLICVPQAGAGAGAFSGWRRHLPRGVEMAPVELPGRGTREREPLPVTVGAVATGLFEALRPEFTMPYVLFGHSLGGILAYDVARQVMAEGLRPPVAVVIAGARAPFVPSLHKMAWADDEQLIAWMIRSGGMPRELLDHPAFLAEIMRAVRADLKYAESYLLPDPPALPWPLHVFGGLADDVTPPEQMPRWARCAGGEFSVTLLPGGHSFPHAAPAALFAAIGERVPALARASVPV